MEIDVTETGEIRLRKVYNPVIFDTEEGETFAICMREDGIEVTMVDRSMKHDGSEVYRKTFYLAHCQATNLTDTQIGEEFIGEDPTEGIAL